MIDVEEMTQRVFALSRAYRRTAGTLLERANQLRQRGELDDGEFAAVRAEYERIVASASDMLVDLDDALAARLDGAIRDVEAATARLATVQSRIAQVTQIVDVALKVSTAAAAVAIFVATPGPASVVAAVGAIGAALSMLPPAGATGPS